MVDVEQINLKTKPSESVQELRRCFSVIVDRKQLLLQPPQLKSILLSDLHINSSSVNERLMNVLQEALMYYMRVWPGWSRSAEYFRGQLTFKEWFERFRQYLIYKMNYVIKNEDTFLKNCKSKLVNADVQTDSLINITEQCPSGKSNSPYVLNIEGPPSVLNSIVFTQFESDVGIKQHSEKPWQPLQIKQILNWPHISVSINLPEISFSRKNLHEFHRYLALCGDITTGPRVEVIDNIQHDATTESPQVYTLNFMKAYKTQFFEVIDKLPQVLPLRITEIKAIFEELLKDIESANLCDKTIATHVSVSYRIGGQEYIRNKKMVNSGKNFLENRTINFYELIVPKVEYTLNYLKANQDPSDEDVSFEYLNEILRAENSGAASVKLAELKFILSNTCIVYYCNFCNLNFSGPFACELLVTHFSGAHKAEQGVLCFKCRRSFDVPSLADNRWEHSCGHNSVIVIAD